ncbi:MAG: flagellar motor protein MotB [Lachnospiraceae bacterium]|nr:flagellar motor protein MotB [Lachnospiraceae bacterium]
MAKKKQEESGGGGAPAWMATFSDLMNLLLCFFVLLFAMSSVDASKWEEVVASMTSAFSIFSSGSTSIGHGTLVGIGTSQLSNLDEYYTSMGQTAQDNGEEHRDTSNQGNQGENQGGANQDPESGGKQQDPESGGKQQDTEEGGKTLQEQLAALGKEETEEMLDSVSELTERYNIGDLLEVSMDGNGTYVQITLSGSMLFESGSATLQDSCLPLLSKVGDILKVYPDHSIEVVGHTDNVPMKSSVYADNDILSSARAISAAHYLVQEKGIDVKRLSWTGRGENDPVASNSTAEGRARNRRIEIRIYNSYNSN